MAGPQGFDPLGINDPLADPLMTANLTGNPLNAGPLANDPLGMPMGQSPYGNATLGRSMPQAASGEGPNWVLIGSIGGVALALLMLVGMIVVISLSDDNTTLADNSAAPGALSSANNSASALPPASAPPISPITTPGEMPFSTTPIPQPTAAVTPSPGDAAVSPAASTTPAAVSPGATPSQTPGLGSSVLPPGGPGLAGATAVPGTATRPSSPLAGSSTKGPVSQGQSNASKARERVRVIPRGDASQAFETDESATPNPKNFAAVLPKWHGDNKAKLIGVLKVGDTKRTTVQGHYSWMHNLLPFLGHQDTYDRFDLSKPLHDDVNIKFAHILVPEYLVPGNPKQRWDGYPFDHFALTHFVGMSGVEDARNIVAGKLDRADPRAGVFGYDRIAAPSEITDGTSSTIMVIGVGELANPWVMGGGSTIRGARQPYFDKLSGFGTHGQNGAMVIMADGSVRLIASSVDPAVFRALCTIHGAETVDVDAAAPNHKLD